MSCKEGKQDKDCKKKGVVVDLPSLPQDVKLMIQSFLSPGDIRNVRNSRKISKEMGIEMGKEMAATSTGYCDCCHSEYWIKAPIPIFTAQAKFHPVARLGRNSLCFERWCDSCFEDKCSSSNSSEMVTDTSLICRECEKKFHIKEAKTLPTPITNDYNVEDLRAVFCSLDCALARVSFLGRQNDYWHTVLSRQRQ